ncbi:PREDICTED: polyphenol oxidase I, chloroplastic-like [Fragaria vesca subsp. vesca]|uniref:polyphenol oxidase I, chloroplastic-like n=1 Tax=Fragaria vesca subsp. vesca TaxID=101020 RepID=UPI0002C336F3|nr:PREDICTED: polyphenol oxidase I, chloroplastic-like [Fragaria vesca subsp. vesca]
MEAAKKWGFAAITLVFIMFAALPLTLLVLRDPTDSWKLTDTILSLLRIIESKDSSGSYKIDRGDLSVTLNLSSCHSSYGRPDLLVYCCPPKSLAEEPVIDFQFPDPSTPLRIRRPAHRVGRDFIAKYKKALLIMKSLPYNDPRSFRRQADMHCLFCTGAYDQPHSHRPVDIHQKWFFFPWHRMLLHFHERIVGSLIGDDTFALPFWNWDSPDGMAMPEWYMHSPFFDDQRDVSHFPPKVSDLNYNYEKTDENMENKERMHLNLVFMYNQMVSAAKKPELFMGCPYKNSEEGVCDGLGTLENAPHNTMHTWVGSNFNVRREDMGAFYSAARDPSFYAHHSNLDRLWEVWTQIHKVDLQTFDSDWLNSSFYFHDENSQLVRIKVRDVLDTTKLRYVYEEVDLPWLNTRPKPNSIPSKIANHALKIRENITILSAEMRPGGQNLNSSITVRVSRSKFNRRKVEKDVEEEVLVVHGIAVRIDEYVKFDVYINVVNESKMGPSFREFAGTFVHIPHGKMDGDQKTNLKFGISELLEDLEADRDESILVTLLPRTKSCTNTTIDGIRIEYMR